MPQLIMGMANGKEIPYLLAYTDSFLSHLQGFIFLPHHIIGTCQLSQRIAQQHSDDMNANGFAKAVTRAMLRYGLAHTIVIDKDSKFRGTFEGDYWSSIIGTFFVRVKNGGSPHKALNTGELIAGGIFLLGFPSAT